MDPEVERRLIEQEHRLIPVVQNYLEHRSNPQLRSSARSALLWYWLRPRAVAMGGVGFVAIIGLFVARQANDLIDEQNSLLVAQNRRIDAQTLVAEAQRNSALFSIWPSIVESVEQEVRAAEEAELDGETEFDPELRMGGVQLSVGLDARLGSLLKSLRPYHYAIRSGDGSVGLSERALSPERGQIAQTLLWMDVDVQAWDFSHADLAGADLSSARLQNVIFFGADLSHAMIWDSDASFSNLSEADLRDARLVNSTFTCADFMDANLERAVLSRADLTFAILAGTDLRDADLSDADLSGAFLGADSWSPFVQMVVEHLAESYTESPGRSIEDPSRARAELRALLESREIRPALMTGTNLSGANLTGTCVSPEQLSQATWDPVNPPIGVDLPDRK